MRIRRFRPELLASADRFRPALQVVALEKNDERTIVAATNGHALIECEVEPGSDDTPGAITPRAINEARKLEDGKQRHRVPRVVCSEKHLALNDGTMFRRPSIDGFPSPPMRDTIMKTSGPPVATVRLDAELLVKLQRALGASAVEVEVRGELDPLIVRPASVGGVYSDSGLWSRAAMMPVRKV